jgi:hypothetical protein
MSGPLRVAAVTSARTRRTDASGDGRGGAGCRDRRAGTEPGRASGGLNERAAGIPIRDISGTAAARWASFCDRRASAMRCSHRATMRAHSVSDYDTSGVDRVFSSSPCPPATGAPARPGRHQWRRRPATRSAQSMNVSAPVSRQVNVTVDTHRTCGPVGRSVRSTATSYRSTASSAARFSASA